MYEQGGRPELAEAEAREVAVIERFLPQQMSEAETSAAIESIKAELGATGMKGHGPGDGRTEDAPRRQSRHEARRAAW